MKLAACLIVAPASDVVARDRSSVAVCPLCGGANGCAIARSGRCDEACWCEAVSFSAALLDRVPEALRGVACVCRDCALAGAPEGAA
jgi:hypothetical protein